MEALYDLLANVFSEGEYFAIICANEEGSHLIPCTDLNYVLIGGSYYVVSNDLALVRFMEENKLLANF